MKWSTVIGLALVAAIAVLALRCRTEQARAEQAEAEELAWHARAVRTAEWAHDSLEIASAAVRQAVRDREVAEALAAHAQAYTDTVEVQVERVRLVTVPDTCRSIVVARDSVIDRLRMVSQGWRSAYLHQTRATSSALRAGALKDTVIDSIAAVLEGRPRPRGEWAPRLTADAGIWSDGMYDAGLTLKLSNFRVYGGLRDGRKYARVGVSYPLW